MECDSVDRVAVILERVQQLARGDVPQVDLRVVTARCDCLTVGTERHVENEIVVGRYEFGALIQQTEDGGGFAGFTRSNYLEIFAMDSDGSNRRGTAVLVLMGHRVRYDGQVFPSAIARD